MPNLLLELFSEEIPARMQARAQSDLLKAVREGLDSHGLASSHAMSLSGPRRLAVHLEGLAHRSDDRTEERKGPKLGAPDKAIQGFLRGAGLTSIAQAEIRSDPKKGDIYVATQTIPGRAAADIIADCIPEIIRKFHWPKSMRTGRGALRWVRPLQRIVCLLDDVVVPFNMDGIESANQTEGHRVHGRGPYTVTGFADYQSQLEGAGHVMLCRQARRDKIERDARALCQAAGLEWIADAGLLEEVAGLAEWPVGVLGDMDQAFLALPPEVIQLSMRTHQKYFAVRDPKTGKLAPHFIVIANIEARDGGAAIAAGNRKVLSARLDDGRFFWENDKKTGLEVMAAKLSRIAFKQGLGTIADKVKRVKTLARKIADEVGADPDLAERAASLAKADLVSEMVYEFPELQGVMGRYYALEAGETAQVADAIRDHYAPQGPSDAVPSDPVSVAVALADKLDTLVGFWAIDEKPTGSKDPFALRRAALGVIRIILENKLTRYPRFFTDTHWETEFEDAYVKRASGLDQLDSFLSDRLAVALKTEGYRHDHIQAGLMAESHAFKPHSSVKRVAALAAFLATPDGQDLVAGYKRATNILRAEEKKTKTLHTGSHIATSLFCVQGEIDLHAALQVAENTARAAIVAEDYNAAMTALAALRGPVDAFFEGPHSVMVNADDAAIRQNRLNLLNALRLAIGHVADFSQLEG